MSTERKPYGSFDSKRRLTATDRRSQILAAAMEVFAEHGFHGTPTRELARRAGVSEGLVFQHFPTKEALISAILDHVGFEDRIQMMEEHLYRMPPREGLLRIAEHLLTNLRDNPTTFRVVFFGLMETPHLAGEFYRKFLSRLLALETRLFERAFAERAAAAGGGASGAAPGGAAAARVDPAIVARSFHGSLMYYNMAGVIVRVEPVPSDPKAMAEAIVNLYLPEVKK
jgi:AcrR family transcriptional regulator